MDHIGIDVHKRESQIYILAESGEVIEQRIRTERRRGTHRDLTRPAGFIQVDINALRALAPRPRAPSLGHPAPSPARRRPRWSRRNSGSCLRQLRESR
jgi:hypothetical protein